jgi:DNA (cytosine-5)-methyltransferase 1
VAIDLFAGAGGFSLGIEQAGFDVAVAVEYDPVHAAVYAFNFPHTKVLCADVATLSGQEIRDAVKEWAKNDALTMMNDERGSLCALGRSPRREAGGESSALCIPHCAFQIDLVFGGPPCQGFSTMGKGLPDDERNNLVFEFCRLVKELQPRYFVMENVPGLCQSKYSHLLKRLMSDFKAAGYVMTEPVQVLDAASFGVPQKRRRLFLLGAQVGAAVLAYPEPEQRETLALAKRNVVQHGERSEAKLSPTPLEYPQGRESQSQYLTVRDAIADLPNLDDFAELSHTDCIQLTPEQLYQMHALSTLYVKKLRDLICDPTNFAYPRWWNPQLLTSSMQTQHTEASIERFKNTSPGQLEPISRLRRLDWDKPCHTLRAGTGSDRGAYTSPRPIHPDYLRVISVREAARLHSFPDWFRFHVTKWHGFRQVGNAVPPLLARALGSQIIAALEVKPSVPPVPLELGDPQLLGFKQLNASKYRKAQRKQ